LRIDPAGVPAPVSQLRLSFPSNLSLATSGLGLAACEPAALQLQGAAACPANSKMGVGSATVAVAFGPEIVHEHVTLGLYAAPSPDGYVHLAIIAEGLEPVEARIVMRGVLLAGALEIDVPAVPSVPGASDVAVTSLTTTLGGSLTYYERSGGRTIAYRPRGISLPSSCPRGGWRLAARLAFLDGTHSRARTVIPCPRTRKRAGP
jgi:hypothetical protein